MLWPLNAHSDLRSLFFQTLFLSLFVKKCDFAEVKQNAYLV
jgi:hypothetical protein